MRRTWGVFFLSILTIGFLFADESLKPTKESLINGWERIQSENSDNKYFEKIRDRVYKIHNQAFEYEGIFQINDLLVERVGLSDNNSWMGTLSIELKGKPDEQLVKKLSYMKWQRDNVLFYQKDKGWVTQEEWQQSEMNKYPSSFSNCGIVSFFYDWIWGILILFLIFFFWSLKRAQSKVMEQTLNHMRKSEEYIVFMEKEMVKQTTLLEEIKNKLRNE